MKNKTTYPRSELKAASLLPVTKTIGIDITAIEDDVEYLIAQFISRSAHTFQDFDQVWNELHFNHVHFACVKKEFRVHFMNTFNSAILDYFSSKLPAIRCSVMFALYFLYMSQPAIWGKCRIRVTKDTWETLFNFYVDSINSDTNIEAALIFDKLKSMDAFLFVSREHIETKSIYEKIEFSKAIEMNENLHKLKLAKIQQESAFLDIASTDMQEYNHIAQEYQASKRETFSTPQAALATKQSLKENLNVTENRPRLLQNVLLSSTLAKDETNMMKHVNRSRQEFLEAKRQKLQEGVIKRR